MKRRQWKCGPRQPGDRMNRREVLAGLLLAFITESAQAQQSGRSKVYRIAFVDPQTPGRDKTRCTADSSRSFVG